jgi:hypothetical protein
VCCAVVVVVVVVQKEKEKEKSRSLRNIFQLLTFSQEVKANSGNKVVSKLPGEGARPKRSPSDPSSSGGGAADDRLYSSGELSDDAPARRHRDDPQGPSPRRSGAPKDPRLTVSAEELRGPSWASDARSHPRATDGDDDNDDEEEEEEDSDEDPERDEADEDGDADEDDDFRESDRKARTPPRRQAASSGDTTAAERHGDGGGHNDDGKAGRKGGETAAADGWKRRKKPKPTTKKVTTTTTTTTKKKKKRKSEAALERRLADIERLRRLVDDLHVLLAGHPVLPALTEPDALRRDSGAAAETRKEEAEEEEEEVVGAHLEWRASTEHVVGKVVEVMLQARALFHSCPDEIQRADILFMARQLNASAHRLADVLDSRPRCPTLLGTTAFLRTGAPRSPVTSHHQQPPATTTTTSSIIIVVIPHAKAFVDGAWI